MKKQRTMRGRAAKMSMALLLALGGCNWILNLEDAASSADGSAGGSNLPDASIDVVVSTDVAVERDAPTSVGDGAIGRDVSDETPIVIVTDSAAPRDSGSDVSDVSVARPDASDASIVDVIAADADSSALPPILACASRQIVGTGTPLATGTTIGGTNSFTGTCGSGSSNDIAFDWIVPATDYYAVSTAGSSFDTVLYLRDAACNGPELACNNNTATTPQSEIVSHFTQGQRLLAVVDGNVGDQGTVAFNAERVTCPAIDLAGQPLPATLSTVGGTNVHTGACGGLNQLERTYRFTPSTTGLYSITAQSTDFPPILYVEQGPRCGGTLLGCSKGAGTTSAYPAEVVRNLTAGQPVTITVDGGSGFFTLNATRLLDEAGVCGAGTLPPNGAMTTIAGRGTSHSTGSCVAAGGLDGVGGGPFPYADVTYNFPVNLALGTSCRYVFDADGPITVYLIQNACSGSESHCVAATAGGTLGYEASFSLGMPDSGMYTLVVENGGFFEVTFTVAVMCIA
jgi:hypothetical protein